MKKYLAILLALALCLGLCACGGNTANEDTTPTEPEAPKVEDDGIMKILLIGHSLGNDSSFMFPDIVKNEGGFDKLVMGVLYHSGCRVLQHVDYAKEDAAQYAYYEYDISTQDEWLRSDCYGNFTPYYAGMANDTYIDDGTIAQTLKFGIQRHDWDLIILQGGLFESANIADAYYSGKQLGLTGYIQELMDYVNANDIDKTTPNKFAWNMVWSTPADRGVRVDSTNQLLDLYCGGDDHNLYLEQVKVLKDSVEPGFDWVYVFPNGTAIENLKTTKLADNQIFRDYAHVTDFGRLVAAYTWYCTITGTAIEDCKIPVMNSKVLLDNVARNTGKNLELTEEQKAILVEAVHNAMTNPYDTTQSQYAE